MISSIYRTTFNGWNNSQGALRHSTGYAIARRSILLLLPLSSILCYVCTSKGVPVTHEEDAARLIGSGFAAGIKEVYSGVNLEIDQQQKHWIDRHGP